MTRSVHKIDRVGIRLLKFKMLPIISPQDHYKLHNSQSSFSFSLLEICLALAVKIRTFLWKKFLGEVKSWHYALALRPLSYFQVRYSTKIKSVVSHNKRFRKKWIYNVHLGAGSSHIFNTDLILVAYPTWKSVTIVGLKIRALYLSSL